MRKIVFAVLLTCCLTVMLVSQAIRVCADAEMWFWGRPNIHDPKIDNDGDGYCEAVTLCIGVRTSYARNFYVYVSALNESGVEWGILQTYDAATKWSESDQHYEYLGHTKLVVPKRSIWDFKIWLIDKDNIAHEITDYGAEPTLTDVKMEPELMALVVRGEDNRIYHRIYNSADHGSWGAWNVVPTGATIDSPAASLFWSYPLQTYALQIVVRGMDGQSLWHCSINLADNSFSGWDRVNGATNSKPTLYKDTLYVRGLDDRVYYSPYDYEHDTFGYTWNVVPSGSTCDSPAADYYCMVVRGMDGNSLWYANRALSGWQWLSGTTYSPPALMDLVVIGWLTEAPPYYYEPVWHFLVVRGVDNSIDWKMSPKSGSFGTWFHWRSGATCDGPAAATIGSDLHLVVRGMDGHSLWHGSYGWLNNVYSGWSLLSGSTPSAPTLAS